MSADYNRSTHIGKMLETATTAASWALGVFRNRTRKVILEVYKSLIRSKLEFSCPLWNPLDVGNIQRIENVQREFTRRITGLQDMDYWARLKNLHLMSLQRRRERYSIIHIWKILNNLSPNDIGLKFTTSDRRGTRVSIDPIPRSASHAAASRCDNSFAVYAARLWNTIPAEATTIKKLDPFKRKLGNFLRKIPDNPPLQGYNSQNKNSILDWNLSNGGLQQAEWPR